MKKREPLHYTACGLDDVYLLNGFKVSKSSRGRVTKIKNIEGLHQAIGDYLIRLKRSLTGKELRFLRTELGLSQANLAKMLGESDQTVARREKTDEREGAPSVQERMTRHLYGEHIGGNESLTNFLKELEALDDQADDKAWKLEADGWRETKRAA
ncbi:MAG: helix-turn-helix domain-containing protein [Alphaproteobacteria bacterium]